MPYNNASGNKGAWKERCCAYQLKYTVFVVRKLAAIIVIRIYIIGNQTETRAYPFFNRTSKSSANDEAISKAGMRYLS